MAPKKGSASLACVHHDPNWNTNPEIVRFTNPLGARYCVVCLDWVRERDRLKFVKSIRAALAEGKNQNAIAKELELEDVGDPFAPSGGQTYFQILLLKSGYVIQDHSLRRVNPLPNN